MGMVAFIWRLLVFAAVTCSLLREAAGNPSMLVEGNALAQGEASHSYGIAARCTIVGLRNIVPLTTRERFCDEEDEWGDTVDVVARFGFPLDLSPCRRARHATLVFGTAEFGIVTPRMLNASANVAMEWWHERRCLARKQSSSSVVRIVTPSKWSRDAFLRSGFAPSHVYVIPHGVDTELIHPPASPEVKRRLQRRIFEEHAVSEGVVFLSVGSMRFNKGIGLLLEAFDTVLQDFPSARLVLKGLDNRYGSLDALLAAHPAAPMLLQSGSLLYFGGEMSRAELADLYKACDVYVTSHLAEAFHLPALEAAAAGLTVVCPSIGPSTEMVHHTFAKLIDAKVRPVHYDGATGRLIEPSVDSLIGHLNFLADPAKTSPGTAFRLQAQREARKHVLRKYSLDRVAEQWRSIASHAAIDGSRFGGSARSCREADPVGFRVLSPQYGALVSSSALDVQVRVHPAVLRNGSDTNNRFICVRVEAARQCRSAAVITTVTIPLETGPAGSGRKEIEITLETHARDTLAQRTLFVFVVPDALSGTERRAWLLAEQGRVVEAQAHFALSATRRDRDGTILHDGGSTEVPGRKAEEHDRRLCASLGRELRSSALFPPIVNGAARGRWRRQRRELDAATRRLVAPLPCDPALVVPLTPWGYPSLPNVYAMYGEGDGGLDHAKHTAALFAKLWNHSVPQDGWDEHRQGAKRNLPGHSRPPEKDAIRVGFISANLCAHSVGKASVALLLRLARHGDLHVGLFPITRARAESGSCGWPAGGRDAVSDALRRAFRPEDITQLSPPRGHAASVEAVRSWRPDVLVYLDPSMHPLSHSLLVLARLAPVQCVFWSNTISSGSPHADYVLASEFHAVGGGMERDFAEQPVRLPGLGTLVVRPSFSPPPPDAALLGHTEAFGTRLRRAASERGWRICLAEDSCDRNAKVIRRLYVCPAALVKVSPQMDETIAEILRRDKEGAVLLLEGRNQLWADALRMRLGKEDWTERVLWLPRLPATEYAEMLRFASVMLDTSPFSGFTTSVEALAAGLPVVTRKDGSHVRGAQTLALLRAVDATLLRGTNERSGDDMPSLADLLGSARSTTELAVRAIEVARWSLEDRARVARAAETFFSAGLKGAVVEANVEAWVTFLRRAVRGSLFAERARVSAREE